ncbi:MAG: alkaline phosphatase family protein [Isosphaeraceae bacterium]
MAKALLIGLDGATFTTLEPLMDSGAMPFLRSFARGGVRSILRSVVPPLTPPAWTSLTTGKHPGGHGVFDFFQKESPESRTLRFTTSHDVRTSTIWSLASEQGRTITALNYPLMFPAPKVNGRVVPGGWMPWRQLRLGCHPPGLFDRLKALPAFNPRELSHDMALEEKALEGCAEEDHADWITLHTRRERRWADVLSHLMTEEPADLTAVLFDGVDKLQHLCWRFLDPALRDESPTPWEAEVSRLCESYFRQLDEILSALVERAGSETTVVMASDHGFGPTYDIVYLNTWLEEQGFLAWSGDQGIRPDANREVGISQIARHVFELDWERTVAYAATPSSQGIHIARRTSDNPFGVTDESYPEVRARLVDALRDFRHPQTGRPVVAEVHTREQVFPGRFVDYGPDLTVFLNDDAVVSILRSDRVIKRRAHAVGTHRPEGVFLASGPGLRKGVEISEISIVDVAPLLLHTLELAVPDDMDGRVPVEAFEPEALRDRPPLTTTATNASLVGSPSSPEETPYDAEDEAIVLKRLAALGYLE